MQFVQLIHTSEIIAHASEAEELDILRKAKEKHLTKRVSGLMFYHNKRCVQLLEGKEDDVMASFEEMKKDPNHRNVTLAAKNSTDKVSLPTWAVAYFSKTLPKSVQKNHPSILNQEQAHAVLASLDHAIGQVFLTTFEKYTIDQQEI